MKQRSGPRPIRAEWALLMAHLPKLVPEVCGVFVLDLESDRLCFHLKPALNGADPLTQEVWEELPNDLRNKLKQFGGAQVFETFAQFGNAFRLGERSPISLDGQTLDEATNYLYQRNVAPTQ